MNDLQPIPPFGSPQLLIDAFCHATAFRSEDLVGTSQTRQVTRLRHELMYLLRQMTVLSLADIGRHVGGRDMATVHAGIANVADRIAADAAYRDRIRDLMDRIHHWRQGPGEAEKKPWPLIAALSILRDPAIGDDEARKVALHFIEQMEAAHA